MRLILTLSPATERVPFSYQELLLSRIHSWLGKDNQYHDAMSNYSFGWLTAKAGGMNFRKGGGWQIASPSEDFFKRLLTGIEKDKQVICGMRTTNIHKYSIALLKTQHYKVGSPILLKNQDKHVTYLDSDLANELLTQSIRHRLDKIGFEDISNQVSAEFTPNKYSKTKLVTINGIENRCSFCDIKVFAPIEAQYFIYDVGVGTSTGCGFGFLTT